MSYYESPDFTPAPPVQTLHSVPRFGHSSNVSNLASDDEQEISDYVVGQIILSAFLLGFFLLWTVVIVAFKCLGRRKVGFLAGFPFDDPRRCYADGSRRRCCASRRPACVRIVFLVCASTLMVFVYLLFTRGLQEVQQMSIRVEEGNKETHAVIEEGKDITRTMLEVRNRTVDLQQNILGDLDDYCPNILLGEVMNMDFTEMSSSLDELNGFVSDHLAGMTETLTATSDASDDVTRVVTSASELNWVHLAYAVPIVALSGVFVIGVLLAMCRKSPRCVQRTQTYVLLPLFALWILFTWIVGSTFFIGGVIASDACSPSPDNTVLSLIDAVQWDPNSLQYKSIQYFVACQSVDLPPFDMSSHTEEIQRGINATDDTLSHVDTYDPEMLNQLCGKDLDPIVDGLRALRQNLVTLRDSVGRIASLLSCERINSIYVNVVHEASCTYGVYSIAWIFSSLLVISVCGMLMITLRSSWLEVASMDNELNFADNDGYEVREDDPMVTKRYDSPSWTDYDTPAIKKPQSQSELEEHPWEVLE